MPFLKRGRYKRSFRKLRRRFLTARRTNPSTSTWSGRSKYSDMRMHEVSESITLPAAGTVGPTTYAILNKIASGGSLTTRAALNTMMKLCRTGMIITPNSSATVPCRVRVMMVYDSAPNRTVFDLPTLRTYVLSQPLGTPYDMVAIRNPAFINRFAVLMDHSYNLPVVTGGSTSKVYNYVVPINRPTTYSSANVPTDTSGFDVGALFLLVWCDAAANMPTFTYINRLFFTDV